MIEPPVAARRPHTATHHGVTLTDEYAWLRDPGYPEVTDPEILAHLAAENAWFETNMAPCAALTERLFQEMKGRIKEQDSSVPQKDGDWLYWTSFDEGDQYARWWRRPVAGGADELLLDENALAEGHDYFRLGVVSISPDARLLAFATDCDGSERFEVRVKDLASGALLPDVIPGTLSGIEWTADNRGFIYCLANEQWRTDNARLHWLGTDAAADIELYHEDDEGFRVSVGKSAQEDWLIVSTGDHATSEVRLIPANDPAAAPILVSPRRAGREYSVDVRGDTLFVLTNDSHVNFRLATAPLSDPGTWTTLHEGSDRVYLTDFALFRDFYVLESREDGLDQIDLIRYDDPAARTRIDWPEASYSAGLGDNPEYAVTTLRLDYESMVTPQTVLDYDIATGTRTILKVREIPSGYDAAGYRTERLMIAARDGTRVPVSVLMRADFPRDGSRPLHLYGYGAYGISIDPGFSTGRLSLVDRGFAFAIAHIRGGDDLGRQWYLDGKLERRTNAFTDFVDVARGLIAKGYTSAGKVTASGGSAGGELMGAVVNSDPDLFGAVVAHVPFVDVLNTMLDATLPLTPGEWPEWGNPIEDKAAFDLIASYSPYDNVRAQPYPPMLVTAGLNDPRVTYWEPAKWVARLREMKTDDALLLFKTNMGAGHGGKSGRWDSLREVAEEYAFILWQTGMA